MIQTLFNLEKAAVYIRELFGGFTLLMLLFCTYNTSSQNL